MQGDKDDGARPQAELGSICEHGWKVSKGEPRRSQRIAMSSREIDGCEAIRMTAQGCRQSQEGFVSINGTLVKVSPGDRKG